MTKTQNLPTPSLLRRLLAMSYDLVLVLALLFLTGVILVSLRTAIAGSPEIGQRALGGVWQIPTFLCMFLVVCHFFVYFWVKIGQTLAMQTWRIKVVDNASGQTISFKQAYIRFFAACLSFALLGLGYWWVLIDKEHRSWHDRLSNSHLLLLPKS